MIERCLILERKSVAYNNIIANVLLKDLVFLIMKLIVLSEPDVISVIC